MISFDLVSAPRPMVVIERDAAASQGSWAHLHAALSRGVEGGSRTVMEVRAEVFLAELSTVREIRALFGETLSIGPALGEQLQVLASDRRAREAVIASPPDADQIASVRAELERLGFKRVLMGFQLENLASISRLPHGADFSVPGAGKTTVALAGHAIQKARGHVDRLIVVAPIAAFEAWKVDAQACLPGEPTVVVHGGPGSVIPARADIVLTNYNRLASDYERLRDLISSEPAHLILDEAHRAKRGSAGVHGRAVLDLAYMARRRDVLTGTPAPQGAGDLVALIRFLYPGQDQQILPPKAYIEQLGRDEDVLRDTNAAIARYFVRTPKSRLGLPPTRFETVQQPMGPIQRAIYEALEGRYRGAFALETESRREFSRLGRIVMYLLEAATNPSLLTAGSDEFDEHGFRHPPLAINGDEPLARLLAEYHHFEKPWKYDYIHEAVAGAKETGEKVLVWTTFVRNIKALKRELAEFEPATIHGGIPSEDAAPPGAVTRESELERFRHDPNCSVLLANPAACGEGISLHHWCHHAIYLDRTFNAGHFLQSQDRIHRLGLQPDVVTRFTLLISEASIDETVDVRLADKVRALAQLMDDPGLVQVALPQEDGDLQPPAFIDDQQAILDYLQGNG